MTTTQVNNSNFYTQSNISLDWNGGYKLEVDISTQANAEGWELDFNNAYFDDFVVSTEASDVGL